MKFNINTLREIIKSPWFSVFIILLFHVNGIFGLLSSHKEWFLSKTPLTLTVSMIMLFRHEDLRSVRLWIVMAIIFTCGFVVEAIGTNTGVIFGEYTYTSVLGFGLFNTPLLIGANWLILIFCLAVVLDKVHDNLYLKSVLGSVAMVAIDYVTEPVAIGLNFWTWEGHDIPLQNYVAWFLISLVLFLILYKSGIERKNKVAPWLLMTWVIFFVSLNLLL
jgi:putative membrane protein